MKTGTMVEETVTMEGHLIDSDILRKAFARVVEGGGDFEILEFKVGKTNDDPSFLRMSVKAEAPDVVDAILEDLSYLGATAVGAAPGRGHGKKRAARTLVQNARFAPAEQDGILPDDFYSTTNFDTFVRVDGKWEAVRDQKMDCAVVLREGAPTCVKQGRVVAGEMVVLRGPGIRVRPPERSRDYSVFGFMSNDVSAETNKGIVIAGAAREMKRTREAGEKIVAGGGAPLTPPRGGAPVARPGGGGRGHGLPPRGALPTAH